jgi:hypothetical protein
VGEGACELGALGGLPTIWVRSQRVRRLSRLAGWICAPGLTIVVGLPRCAWTELTVPSLRLKSDRYLADPGMDQLRARAQDLGHAEDWAAVYELRHDLERDDGFWPDLWGPLCALAARQLGKPGAVDLLAELVEAGFSQPQLFDGKLEDAFGSDPDWPALSDRMAHNISAAPLVLTDWPVLTPAAPLGLLALPERAPELRELAPPPSSSAWRTAQATLKWVTYRWQHANAHMETDDAVECLHRVDAGARFACVEYSLVLAQVLNALAIPARRLSLRQENYHAGLGRAHAVSEAWIDDFCRWVVLDGQNGLYWTGDDGEPVGAVELQQALRSGSSRPTFVTFRDDISETDADTWFSYFSHVTSSAGTWEAGPFGVVFQRDRLATSNRLDRQPDSFYPDLSELGVQTILDGNRPALQLTAAHPYAQGFAVDGQPLLADILALDLPPGVHDLTLAVRTDYGTLPGRHLRYRIAL